MKITYKELLSKAQEFSRANKEWHHHYLPPNCLLNSSSRHLIILECNNEKWEVEFEEKPLEDLEQLENLFFKRTI